jgi:hypothetical protein
MPLMVKELHAALAAPALANGGLTRGGEAGA